MWRKEDSVILRQTVKCFCVYEMKVYRTALLAIDKGVARKKLNNINIITDSP